MGQAGRLKGAALSLVRGWDTRPAGGADAIAYRPEIDGLRAVAVLSVLLYHLGFWRTPGGFVGVDVFFVISGFLIGGQVAGAVQAGRFSLADFYQRRIRRILPALMVMLAGTTLAAWVLLFPAPAETYGRSLLAAVLSVSNIWFWRSTDYFAAAAETHPLLHTWSLSVEEQFYLVLPLVMMICARWVPGRMRLVIAGLALASLAASVWGVAAAPTATFYLLPTRAWELLLGVLLALGMVRAPEHRLAREVLALAGLALIALTVLTLKSAAPFPGLAALPPCLGAAMVIAAARSDTLAGRFLSWRPMVFVGLISYSLYLWHWPVIVFLKEALVVTWLGKPQMAAAALASFALAILSWWFVERPFRRGAHRPGVTFGAGAGATALMALAAAILIATSGAPGRYSPEVRQVTAALDYPTRAEFRGGRCFIERRDAFSDFDAAFCLAADPARPDILLVGDSHGAHLWGALQRGLPGAHVQQATASYCKPTITHRPTDRRDCAQVVDHALRTHLVRARPDLLLLAARWDAADLPALEATLDWAAAHGVPAAVIGPVPEYDLAVPLLLGRELEGADRHLHLARLRPAQARTDTLLAAAMARRGVPYGSAYRALCQAGDCVLRAPAGTPVQFDYGHLTAAGADLVVARLKAGGLFNSGTAYAIRHPTGPTTTQTELSKLTPN